MIDVDHADERKYSEEASFVSLEALLETIDARRRKRSMGRHHPERPGCSVPDVRVGLPGSFPASAQHARSLNAVDSMR
jgi:hypothetical protein